MSQAVPRPFALRRIHSIAGLWFLLFLMEHLLTNSQAALWVGESGKGFIDAVNFIHNLPYLTVIEVVLLGVPILAHVIIGIKFALQSKMNSFSTDGTKPALPQYSRNRAYSWQRITSYFLLVMLIFHVGRFRFMEYPKHVGLGDAQHYLVQVSYDPGIYTVASRLNAQLYDKSARDLKIQNLSSQQEAIELSHAKDHFLNSEDSYNSKAAAIASEAQFRNFEVNYKNSLLSFDLNDSESLIADCSDFGTASIFSVRDTMKNKIYATLYTLFVLAAVFHGCNGFWTFCLTWGVIFRKAAQMAMVSFSLFLMFLLGFLGLAAIWGTYFVTLKN